MMGDATKKDDSKENHPRIIFFLSKDISGELKAPKLRRLQIQSSSIISTKENPASEANSQLSKFFTTDNKVILISSCIKNYPHLLRLSCTKNYSHTF